MPPTDGKRDPRVEPKAGDVLLPKRHFAAPLLVIHYVIPWDEIGYVQPYAESITRCQYQQFVDWVHDAEVLHAAD